MNLRCRGVFGKDFWIFLILCAFAFCARFFLARGQSLWTDEVAGVLMSDREIGGIVGVVALFDVNPPLSYFFIRLALLLGRNDVWLRIPFEILGALSCGLLFILARRAGMKNSWLAGLFLAIMPMHLYLSQEVRHYALSSIISILWMLTLLAFEEDSKRARGAFIVVRLLGILNHYFFFFLFFVDWIYLVWSKRKDSLKKLLWYHALIGIYFLPWLPALIHQILAKTYKFRLPTLPHAFFSDLFSHMFFYAADSPEPTIVAWSKQDFFTSPVVLAMPFLFLMLASVGYFRETNRAKRLIVCWFFVPIILVALLAWKIPLYQHRYFVIVLGAFCAMLAMGLEILSRLSKWVAIAFGSMCLFIWTSVLYEYHSDKTYHREDWRGLAQYLDSQADAKKAGVLTYTQDSTGGLAFYYKGKLTVYYAIPSKGFEFGRYDMEEINARLRAIGNLDELFFVDHYRNMFDPDSLVYSWLVQRYDKVEDFWDRFRIRGGRYVRRAKNG